MEAQTLCDTLSDAQPLIDTLAHLLKQWLTRFLTLYLRFRQKRKATH